MGDRSIFLVLGYLTLGLCLSISLYDRWADRRIFVFWIVVCGAIEFGLRAIGLHP